MNNFWEKYQLILTVWAGVSTVVSSVFAYIFYDRKKNKQEETKTSIDIEIREIDYAEKVRDLYESILLKKDAEISYLSEQVKSCILEAKEDREYFRNEINPLREELEKLRKQVSELDLRNAITKEVSDNWEKKFNDLQKEHDQLKTAFDKYKKLNK